VNPFLPVDSLATLPWEYPSSCKSSMWKESNKVGCLSLWYDANYYHKALKGDVYYDSTRTKPVMTYDGSYGGCKQLGLSSVKGLSYKYIDGDEERYSTLEFFKGWYITYNKNGACFLYGAPGTDNGCDRFRAMNSDRVAMLCKE